MRIPLPLFAALLALSAARLSAQDPAFEIKSAAQQHGLGEPRSDTPQPRASLDGRGWWQAWGGGTVTWLPGEGAHLVAGAFLPPWEQQKGVDGALGFPLADAVVCDAAAGASFQRFEHGVIFSRAGVVSVAQADAGGSAGDCAWASAPQPAQPQAQPVPQGQPVDPGVVGHPAPPTKAAPATSQPVGAEVTAHPLPPPAGKPVTSTPAASAAVGVAPQTAATAPRAGPHVSNPAALSHHPDLAVEGSDVYAVWVEEAGGRASLEFTHSQDGGRTFSLPVSLFAGARVSPPHVATLAHRVYVTWSGAAASAAPGEVYLSSSDDDGLTFSDPRNLSRSAADSRNPVLALTRAHGADRVYVAWEERRQRAPDILVTALDAAPVDVSHNPGNSVHPALAALGDTVVVAWVDDLNDTDVRAALSMDGGRTYRSPERPLWLDNGPGYGPAVALGRGRIYLTYEDDHPTRLTREVNAQRRVTVLEFTGFLPDGTPTGYRPVAANANHDCACNPAARAGNLQPMGPQVAVEGNTAYSAWTQYDSGLRSIYLLPLQDGRPGLSRSFNGTAPADVRVLAAGGRSALVYRDRAGGAYDIFVAWPSSGAQVNLSATPAESGELAAALSADRLCAAWTDTTPGNAEVLVRCVPAR